MNKIMHQAYERPEAEILEFSIESSFLVLSVTDKKDDPVGGAEEGDTDGWGWN